MDAVYHAECIKSTSNRMRKWKKNKFQPQGTHVPGARRTGALPVTSCVPLPEKPDFYPQGAGLRHEGSRTSWHKNPCFAPKEPVFRGRRTRVTRQNTPFFATKEPALRGRKRRFSQRKNPGSSAEEAVFHLEQSVICTCFTIQFLTTKGL